MIAERWSKTPLFCWRWKRSRNESGSRRRARVSCSLAPRGGVALNAPSAIQMCAACRTRSQPGAPKITTLAGEPPLSYRWGGSPSGLTSNRGGNRSSSKVSQFGGSPSVPTSHAFFRLRVLAPRSFRLGVSLGGRTAMGRPEAPPARPLRCDAAAGRISSYPVCPRTTTYLSGRRTHQPKGNKRIRISYALM